MLYIRLEIDRKAGLNDLKEFDTQLLSRSQQRSQTKN